MLAERLVATADVAQTLPAHFEQDRRSHRDDRGGPGGAAERGDFAEYLAFAEHRILVRVEQARHALQERTRRVRTGPGIGDNAGPLAGTAVRRPIRLARGITRIVQ